MKYNQGFFTSYISIFIGLILSIGLFYLYYRSKRNRLIVRIDLLASAMLFLFYFIFTIVLKILGKI